MGSQIWRMIWSAMVLPDANALRRCRRRPTGRGRICTLSCARSVYNHPLQLQLSSMRPFKKFFACRTVFSASMPPWRNAAPSGRACSCKLAEAAARTNERARPGPRRAVRRHRSRVGDSRVTSSLRSPTVPALQTIPGYSTARTTHVPASRPANRQTSPPPSLRNSRMSNRLSSRTSNHCT